MDNLAYAQHPNIIQFYGVTEVPQSWVGMVTEYMQGGSLYDLVTDDEVIDLPYLLRHQFCKEIAEGLKFLHATQQGKRLVHGDIKLENVLLTRNLVCKIGDLGSSRLTTITGLSSISDVSGFTPRYAAPELLKGRGMSLATKSSKASDMFSYGMMNDQVHSIKRS